MTCTIAAVGAVPTDQVRQVAPPPDLADDVEAFIMRSADTIAADFAIFPAARAELMFHFADPVLAATDGASRFSPVWRAALLGPRTRRCRQYAGPRIDWLIVQLTPSGCRRFLGLAFADIVGRDAPLEDIMPRADLLWQRLSAASEADERTALVIDWLRDRPARPSGDAALSRLASFSRIRAVRSVGRLAGLAETGERRLRQRFAAEIGMPPRQWLSLMRANRFLWSLHPGAPPGDFEFADDSHAIREFKRFAGMTPRIYLALKAAGNPCVSAGRNQPLDMTERWSFAPPRATRRP